MRKGMPLAGRLFLREGKKPLLEQQSCQNVAIMQRIVSWLASGVTSPLPGQLGYRTQPTAGGRTLALTTGGGARA